MRHLKVDYVYSFAEDSNGFERQVENYNRADVIYRNGRANGIWDICYASSMKRARRTASLMYKGNITITDSLKEVPVKAVFYTRLPLPVMAWFIAARLAWLMKCKSQPEGKSQSRKRARDFIHAVCKTHSPDTNVLVVSHGLFILNLRKMLKEYGFKGRLIVRPGHAKLYVYEK
jgi:broad specificity phosphatase PhoE